MVYVVLDSKGQGRIVGVFDDEAKANEIRAVSPTYYRVVAIEMNAINPDSVRWVQDEQGRQTLERLSIQTRAIPDDDANDHH